MSGITIWILIGIATAFLIFIMIFLFFLCLNSKLPLQNLPLTLSTGNSKNTVKVEKVVPSSSGVSLTISDSTGGGETERVLLHIGLARKASHRDESTSRASDPNVDSVKGSSQSKYDDVFFATQSNRYQDTYGEISPASIMETSELAWGQFFTLKELEAATNGFSQESIIGEGVYGIVYKGRLTNTTLVAIKSLLNDFGQAEKEFKIEIEAVGRVRHKNLVRLLGLCMEGQHRMLVYEYVDNGNLEQWLHGSLGKDKCLTWDTRMKIVLGTAKALAYLHEALEPKVVHRDIKSRNILLDNQWNAKVSDFGLAKLLAAGRSYATTRVMGTFGYVAPEYANTGLVNEKSDVYSFGVLLLETITGRTPVDLTRLPEEVHLVDWLKVMVGSRRSEDVLDPHLSSKPSPRLLKRTLLVALLCIDPDPEKRPIMSHVVHMLESEVFPHLDVTFLFHITSYYDIVGFLCFCLSFFYTNCILCYILLEHEQQRSKQSETAEN